jgi:hypothetical protein
MKDKHDSQQQDGAKSAGSDETDDDLNEKGDRFVTLAMDATTGATEAFQLSDVTIQMVHEGLFDTLLGKEQEQNNPPLVTTKHPVLVDGQETKALDSVLCLVNTAVLSHVGSYSGSGTRNPTKKSNGGMTLKTKKLLVKALDSSDANDFFREVCDFNTLLALDEMLRSSSAVSSKSKKTAKKSNNDDDDMKVLCGLVRKWARGQKKGTVLDSKFKMKLKTYLS